MPVVKDPFKNFSNKWVTLELPPFLSTLVHFWKMWSKFKKRKRKREKGREKDMSENWKKYFKRLQLELQGQKKNIF